MVSVPQVSQSVFPCGEGGIGVEFVVDCNVLVDKHVYQVQYVIVKQGEDWGFAIYFANDSQAAFEGFGILMS